MFRAGRTGRMGRPGAVVGLLPVDRLDAHKRQIKKVTREVQVRQLRALQGAAFSQKSGAVADSSQIIGVVDSGWRTLGA